MYPNNRQFNQHATLVCYISNLIKYQWQDIVVPDLSERTMSSHFSSNVPDIFKYQAFRAHNDE